MSIDRKAIKRRLHTNSTNSAHIRVLLSSNRSDIIRALSRGPDEELSELLERINAVLDSSPVTLSETLDVFDGLLEKKHLSEREDEFLAGLLASSKSLTETRHAKTAQNLINDTFAFFNMDHGDERQRRRERDKLISRFKRLKQSSQ